MNHQTNYINNIKYFLIFAVLFETIVYLSNDMIMPGMVNVVEDFSAAYHLIPLSLALYIFGGCLLQLFLGPIVKIYRKTWIIIYGSVIFTIFSIVIAISSSASMFFIARFFQGLGLCFIFINYAIVHQYFNDKQAVKIISIIVNITILAPLIGPAIGSIIIANYHWRFVFLISIIASLISCLGMIKFRHFDKAEAIKKEGIGYFGIVKLSFSEYGKILTSKPFMIGMTANVMSFTPMIAWIGLGPNLFLIGNHTVSLLLFSIYQVVVFFGMFLSNLVIQFIAGKIKIAHLMLIGIVLIIVGLIASCVFYSHIWIMIAFMSVYSFGLGLISGIFSRIILKDSVVSIESTSALYSVLSGLGIAVILVGFDYICELFNFSLSVFTNINLFCGLIAFAFAIWFIYINWQREWK